MAEVKRISNKPTITNGTQTTNLSLNDIFLSQHVTGDDDDTGDKQIPLSQVQAIPYGVCGSASDDDKTVTLINYPDSFTAQVGTKILVKFTNKNTKGSASGGTYPNLTAGGVTKPILAKGLTVGTGVPFANQMCELTLTPDGWNIDQDVREVGSSYTIMANGDNVYTTTQVNGALTDYDKLSELTDANLCIPTEVNHEKTYNLLYSSANLPNSTYNAKIKSTLTKLNASSRYYCMQECTNFGGSNPLNKYIRSGNSTNSGATWTWSAWVKITTETDLTKLFANCTMSVSGSTLTITNGSYSWTLNGTALTSTVSDESAEEPN